MQGLCEYIVAGPTLRDFAGAAYLEPHLLLTAVNGGSKLSRKS